MSTMDYPSSTSFFYSKGSRSNGYSTSRRSATPGGGPTRSLSSGKINSHIAPESSSSVSSSSYSSASKDSSSSYSNGSSSGTNRMPHYDVLPIGDMIAQLLLLRASTNPNDYETIIQLFEQSLNDMYRFDIQQMKTAKFINIINDYLLHRSEKVALAALPSLRKWSRILKERNPQSNASTRAKRVRVHNGSNGKSGSGSDFKKTNEDVERIMEEALQLKANPAIQKLVEEEDRQHYTSLMKGRSQAFENRR